MIAFDKTDVEKTFKEIKKIGKVAPGIDKITYGGAQKFKDNYVDYVFDALTNKREYHFSKYKEVLKIKGRDKYPRVLSVPCIRDRLMLKMIHNYYLSGHIVRKPFTTVIEELHSKILSKKYNSILKVDIKSFFDNIRIADLESELCKEGFEPHIIEIILNALKTSTVSLHSNKRSIPRIDASKKTGIPQGIIISNSLSEIIGKQIDNKVEAFLSTKSATHLRFVDDIVVLYNSKQVTKREILQNIKSVLKSFGLSLNSNKTHLFKIDKEFEFMGYIFNENNVSLAKDIFQRKVDKIERVIFDFARSKNAKIVDNYKYLIWKLNVEVTGIIANGQYYSWIHYYRNVDDMKIYHRLDHQLVKLYKKAKLDEKQLSNIKTFVKARHCLFDRKSDYFLNVDSDYKTSIEKKKFLIDVFGAKSTITDSIADELFDSIIQKTIYETEKDLDLKFSI